MKNFYRKNKSNVDLFESYALQLVSGMLLYERIKIQQKKLYLEAITKLIFHYEKEYCRDSHKRLLEKLKSISINSFSVVEHIFKIEFEKSQQVKFEYNGKSIDEVFGSETEERKMQSVENWIKFVKRPLPKCFQTYIENLHEDEKERLRELYREFHEKKENIHRVFEEIDYETGEIL